MPYNLLGRWVGGPYNSTVILEATSTGAHGKFKCPSGKWGSIKGIMMKGGARIKGTFVDPDASSSGTSSVDINLDSSGTSWSAHVNVDGRSSSWSGKKPEWRKAGGSQAVWYKNKASWERLLSVNVAKTKEWQEKQRAKLLEDSFDESGRRLRNALLCEAPALAVGEPYGGRNATISSRHRGRTFVAGRAKFMSTNGYFSEPKPLAASGEKYLDATERRRRALAAKREKEKEFERGPFKPTGAREVREANPGYLTAVDKTTDPAVVQELLKEIAKSNVKPVVKEVITGPKNFVTNPPRRGHYGQPGSLLGHRTQDAAKLFEHASDPYDEARLIERRRRAAERKRLEDRDLKPFRSASSRTSHPFTKDSEMYKGVAPGGPPTRPRRRRRPQSAPMHGRAVAAPDEDDDKPDWKPNNPAKRGPIAGSFGGIPKYVPDPEPARQLKKAEDVGELKWAPNATGHQPRPVQTVMLNKTNIRRLLMRPHSARPRRTHSSSYNGR